MPNFVRSDDPLKWWESTGEKNQTSTAIKYLINPDTSIPAERVFSTKKIHQLGPKTANMIIVFINSKLRENFHKLIIAQL